MQGLVQWSGSTRPDRLVPSWSRASSLTEGLTARLAISTLSQVSISVRTRVTESPAVRTVLLLRQTVTSEAVTGWSACRFGLFGQTASLCVRPRIGRLVLHSGHAVAAADCDHACP
jgi:hypothetical protein